MRIALLVLLCALASAADAQYGLPLNCDALARNGDCALYGISLVQLLANPGKFDGEHVRVVGYIHFGTDSNAIYLHRDDLEFHLKKNGVWVELGEGQTFDACQDTYVLIEGLYQARSTGRMNQWNGAITHVTRCQKM